MKKFKIMGMFITNILDNYAFLVNGTKTNFEMQSTRTNSESIVHVGYTYKVTIEPVVTANLGPSAPFTGPLVTPFAH